MTFDQHPLDTRARQAHAASLRALSPRVRAQLQRRTRLALAGEGPANAMQQPRWGWVAAPALALLLAFALPSPGPRDANTDTAAPAAVATQAAPVVELAAPLEQDPDFYLWLASADAVALAGDRP